MSFIYNYYAYISAYLVSTLCLKSVRNCIFPGESLRRRRIYKWIQCILIREGAGGQFSGSGRENSKKQNNPIYYLSNSSFLENIASEGHFVSVLQSRAEEFPLLLIFYPRTDNHLFSEVWEETLILVAETNKETTLSLLTFCLPWLL